MKISASTLQIKFKSFESHWIIVGGEKKTLKNYMSCFDTLMLTLMINFKVLKAFNVLYSPDTSK